MEVCTVPAPLYCKNLPSQNPPPPPPLLQVVPAQYAFVLHTTNPVSRNAGESVGEMVLGMGETLVGNHPGR